MYIISDNLKTIGEAAAYNGSVLEALVKHLQLFPSSNSLCVYFDTSSRLDPAGFQFISFLSKKQISKIKNKFNITVRQVPTGKNE